MYEGAIDSCFFLLPPFFGNGCTESRRHCRYAQKRPERNINYSFRSRGAFLVGKGRFSGPPPFLCPPKAVVLTLSQRSPFLTFSQIPNPHFAVAPPPPCFLSISGSFDLEKALFSFFPGNKWLFCGGGGLGKRGEGRTLEAD